MFESKYNVGEKVFVVSDYKVVKVEIKEIICRKVASKAVVEYLVVPINSKKETVKAFAEAYLVKDFDKAKESALINWESIYGNVKNALNNLKESDFDIKIDE